MEARPRVLILEDNFFTAKALSDAVREHGYDVAGVVGQVQGALDFLQRRDIDGAIVDINLRGHSSFPVCEELERMKVPFFFLSGYDRSVIPLAFGGHRLLSKPVEYEELEAALAEFDPGTVASDGVVEWLGNALLDGLARATTRVIAPLLERVPLEPGQVLHAVHEPVPHVHFPIDGLVSLFARDARGYRLAVGMVGREGIVGATEILSGGAPAFSEAIVELPGEAWRIASHELSPLLRAFRDLRTGLLTHANLLIDEIAQTAVVIGHGTVKQRLARWLLAASTRSGRTHLELTHQHLSQVLGVRRAGITTALHDLEGLGAIKSYRQLIRVTDADLLRRAAEGSA
jgi:CRP-like cAMP-binding protein